jgi:sugar/nucleoside kinase (ribokinase family)
MAGNHADQGPMQALFIGHTYIDVTFLTDRLPVGDEKYVASAYAISFGGNAVTAAFCCAKLSIVPDLLTTVADDWLGCVSACNFGSDSNLVKLPSNGRFARGRSH